MTNGSLMKVESIAECSKGSILQYFWPALSDNWSWKPIFGLFKSGRFTQVLLYSIRYKLACACSEESNQSAHLYRLISLNLQPEKHRTLGYPYSAQWRFWSDCIEVQAYLNLGWAPMLTCTFCSYGPRCEKTCLRGFANNKRADQPAHLRRLISAFIIP